MKVIYLFSAMVGFGILAYFNVFQRIEEKIHTANNYKSSSIVLSKENRELSMQVNSLQAQVKKLEAEKNFLSIKIGEKKIDRSIASIPEKPYEDLVNYDVYKWSPDKLLAIGDREFKYKNYAKAAQYYNELLNRFPHYEGVNDKVMFSAGVSAYESKKFYDWSIAHLDKLIKKYPTSEYYRGAKLWIALSQFKKGNKKEFLSTVEEFRMKYRNTKEWKFLSKHYEDLIHQYGKEML